VGKLFSVRGIETADRATDDVPGWSLAVPLVLRDRLVGLAMLPIPEDAGGFGDAQLALAMGLAQAAGIAIEHARLYGRARELGMAEERNRLAREMHDTLAQGLAAISIQLDVAERLLPAGAEAKRVVEGAHDLARRALDEARRAVWGLAPSALDGRSLSAALADEVERFTHRSGVEAALTAEGDAPTLGDEQATALLRVAQEALHNVEKHAAAGRVRVELARDERDGTVSLLLADDGRGFDRRAPVDPYHGFGLTSMRERMRLVGGELEIESAPNWGTRVRARLPLGVEEPRSDGGGLLPTNGQADAAPVRVLVVDDHPLARQGVRRLLEGQPDLVLIGEAVDGAQGVEQALALRPDVVLMDLQMPQLSGAGAVRALRQTWPEARVLVLTTFARDEDVFEALQAGARGYLLKDASQAELIDAIRTVHRGGSAAPPSIAARVFDRVGQLAERERLPEGLTERELDVLRLAAAGARNKEIAERLVVSEKTVKNYLSQVYGKLGAGNRTEAVARARALGILPLESPALDASGE